MANHDEPHMIRVVCVCRCSECWDKDGPRTCVCPDCICRPKGEPAVPVTQQVVLLLALALPMLCFVVAFASSRA